MLNMTIREKNTITLGGLLAVLFLAAQFAFLPLVDKKKNLERILEAEKAGVSQVLALQAQYHEITRALDFQQQVLDTRPPDFTLFSFLDAQAQKTGVKEYIDYMRPVSQDMGDGAYVVSSVKLKLNHIFLHDFVIFLAAVEKSGSGVQVVSLAMNRTGGEKKLLEVIMEARTLMPKEAG
jgi:hypothetical protein